jgi:hypothetical protein
LQSIFKASDALLKIIREREIDAKPADLLVRLEGKDPRKARTLADRVGQGIATSADLEKVLQEVPRPRSGSLATACRDVDLKSDDNKLSLRVTLTSSERTPDQVQRICKAFAEVMRRIDVAHLDATYGENAA